MTQSLEINSINIGANQTSALTKILAALNIGFHKILKSTKDRLDKILALTKYWRRQKIGVDKILAATKDRYRQNIGAHKKNIQVQRSISLLFWPGKVPPALSFGCCETFFVTLFRSA
jgi:hypothetical protein